MKGEGQDGGRGTIREADGRLLPCVTSERAQRRMALRKSTRLVNSMGGGGGGRPTRWSIVKTRRWDKRNSLRWLRLDDFVPKDNRNGGFGEKTGDEIYCVNCGL